MAENSKIEWTDDTWNPIRARAIVPTDNGAGKERTGWHCEHVSPGCKACYAEGINRRLGTGFDFKPAHLKHDVRFAQGTADTRGEVTMFLDERMLVAPLRRRSARMVFPCSMTDLFGRFVESKWIDRMFAIMALTPQHTFQVVTKRPERMLAHLCAPDVRNRVIGQAWEILGHFPKLKHNIANTAWPLRNVWAGASVEDQQRADERRPFVDALSQAGWITWVSYEPALGPVDWTGWDFLSWMVSGGESGPKANPTHPEWHRAARDYCAKHGIDFLFKQWGEWAPREEWSYHAALRKQCAINLDGSPVSDDDAPQDVGGHRFERVGKKAAGRLLDGVEHSGFPEVLL